MWVPFVERIRPVVYCLKQLAQLSRLCGAPPFPIFPGTIAPVPGRGRACKARSL